MTWRWTNPKGETGAWCETRDAAIADAVAVAVGRQRGVGAVPMSSGTPDPGLVTALWAGLERAGWTIEEKETVYAP